MTVHLPLLPASTRRWLAEVPRDRPVIALLRHAARGPLPDDGGGAEVPLTSLGVRAALSMGAAVGDWLKSVHTSPLRRTVQTAEALLAGAALTTPPSLDNALGDPGLFITDGHLAGDAWRARGHVEIVKAMIRGDIDAPGFASPPDAARRLMTHMLGASGDTPGLYAFVTHDSVLSATLAHTLQLPHDEAEWPDYLEAMWVWPGEGGLWAAYRDTCRALTPAHRG
jgi:broad specificity phosphatase PhoE